MTRTTTFQSGFMPPFMPRWLIGLARVFEFAFEQLRRPAQPAERIPDFMRKIADEFAIRQLQIHLHLLARQPDLRFYEAKFDQKPRRMDFRPGNQAIQVQASLPRARQA